MTTPKRSRAARSEKYSLRTKSRTDSAGRFRALP